MGSLGDLPCGSAGVLFQPRPSRSATEATDANGAGSAALTAASSRLARRSIGGEPPEWHPGRDRLGDHRPSLPRLDGKLRLRRDPRRPAPLRVTGPGLGTYSSGVRGPRPGDTASLERPPDRSFMVGGGMTARLTPPGVEDDPGTRSNGDLTVNGTLTGQVVTSGRPFTRRRVPQGGGGARV